MLITAKFASNCPVCNGRIIIGARVEWSRGSKAIHAACYADVVAVASEVAAAAPVAAPVVAAAPVAVVAVAPVAAPVAVAAVAAPTVFGEAVDFSALGFKSAVKPVAVAAPIVAITNANIVTGAAAEGYGALAGWAGLGELRRDEILAALTEAELPADWAPAAKSAKGYAGVAVAALNNRGYISRAARVESARGTARRNWRARWVVAVADAAAAEVNEPVGRVVLSIELPSGSDTLRIEGHEVLGARVLAEYEELKSGEVFAAGDVTAWFSRVLTGRCGATRFGVGYYIPTAGRLVANKLSAALAKRWGAGWISPLLPVATTDELRVGVARGLADDVAGIARSLESRREAARRESREDVRPGEAAALGRELADIHERLGAYRILCSDAVIAPIVAEIAKLRETLRSLTNDASLRFSLLELNTEAEIAAAAPVVEAPTLAERAADAATERRLAEPVAPVAAAPAERKRPITEPPVIDPNDKAAEASYERFSLLELD